MRAMIALSAHVAERPQHLEERDEDARHRARDGAGALVQARMGHLIYAARDPKRGAMGSTINLAEHCSAHHVMQVTGGVLEEQASAMLATWFRQRRRRPDGSVEARSRTS